MRQGGRQAFSLPAALGIADSLTSEAHMRVFLASFPRSGNTFLRHVIETVYGWQTYTVYQDERIENVFDGDRQWAGQDAPVACIKTHETWTPQMYAYGDGWSRAIHLVRDGRDTLISLVHRCTTGDYHDNLRAAIDGQIPNPATPGKGFDWSEHTRSWRKRVAPTQRLYFRDLIADPVETVCHTLSRLGVSWPESGSRPLTFTELQQRNPAFFRRGKTNAWRDEMPLDLQKRFWDRHGAEMVNLGYTEGQV